jgi:hypothetical protein
MDTVLDFMIQSILEPSEYNQHEQVKPAVILWTLISEKCIGKFDHKSNRERSGECQSESNSNCAPYPKTGDRRMGDSFGNQPRHFPGAFHSRRPYHGSAARLYQEVTKDPAERVEYRAATPLRIA